MNIEEIDQFTIWTQLADIQDICFWRKHRFLTSSDDGAVRLWDERTKDAVLEILDAHESRVKALDVLNDHLFVSASSDGEQSFHFPFLDLIQARSNYGT